MINFLLTLAIGFALGYVFYKLDIPGGMMIGAIVGVATLNIIWGMSYMPTYAKSGAQIIAGAFIGCSVEKSDIPRLKYLIKPALILLTAFLALNIILGYVIYFTSPLDLMTSMMSCVPGGMSDIPLISADLGADTPKVAIMQFVRMAIGIGLFPTLISAVTRHENKRTNITEPDKSIAQTGLIKPKNTATRVFILTISIASVFGIIGKILDIPAGALLFSMIGVICLKLVLNMGYMPIWIKRFAQILSGAYIGCSIGYSDILELKYICLPALLLLLGYFATCFIVGKVLNKFFDMPLNEAMLIATPAGASDIALIASDLGVQSTDLVLLQIIRLVLAVSVFPQIINLIVTL